MNKASEETNRRRSKQLAYNRENPITPQSIIKSVDMGLARIVEADYITVPADDAALDSLTAGISGEGDLQNDVTQLELQIREAAKKFQFSPAAQTPDLRKALKHPHPTTIDAPH